MWYHVSEPNSYLAVTGVGIENVRITKKCFVMPFQKVTKISITPFDFSIALQAVTNKQIAAERAAQHKLAELQRGAEEKRDEEKRMELARLRATTVTRADLQKSKSVSSAGTQEWPHGRMVYEPEIPGYLNDKAVAAFPDSGSARNIVSHEFVKRNQLNIDTSTGGVIQTAAGSRVRTLGTVNLLFRFSGERDAYMQQFHVLSKSLYDVILGSPFLQSTKTFARQFAHRVKRKLRSISSSYRVCFTGSCRQMLAGWADGEPTNALPDTGSDVCLMSLAYARARGYRINTDYEHRKQLEFVDGSTATTMGLVEGFQWKFDLSSSQVHYPHVYVLEGLRTELLFSYEFVMSSDAFGAYSALFISHDPSEEPFEGWLVNAVKLVRESKLGQRLAQRIGWESSKHHNQGPSELQKWHTKKRDESEKYAVNYTAALALSEPQRSKALASVESEWQAFWATWPGCGTTSHCTAQNPCRTAGCNFQLKTSKAASISTSGIRAVAESSRARDPFVLAANAALACQSSERHIRAKKDAEDHVSLDTANSVTTAAARTQAKYSIWCGKLIALQVGLLLIWCLGLGSGMINFS